MFAENNTISGRQLFRQTVLGLLAPLLLCLAGRWEIHGFDGIFGVAAAAGLLCLLASLLVKLGPACVRLTEYLGKWQSAAAVVVYLAYIVLTAAFVLDLVSRLAADWLLPGAPGWCLRFAIAAVCAAGSHGGMEKRARMGEVSFMIVVGALTLLIVLAFTQGDPFPLEEFAGDTFSGSGTALAAYRVLCGFLPLALLPFVTPRAGGASDGRRALRRAVLTLALFLAAIVVLLPIALGRARMLAEPIPILPLLAGTNLPGDVLARFDVIWIALLVYALLYSLGSLFYYGSHIPATISLPLNHWVLAGVVLLFSIVPVRGQAVGEYYGVWLTHYLAPAMVLVTCYIYIRYRRRRA